MSQSLSKIYVHIVFSTKNRKPYLDTVVCDELYPYLATVLSNLGSPALEIGGIEDHVHILCALSKTQCIANLVKDIKTPTSKWLKTTAPTLRDFAWQSGYGAFSIGQSTVAKTRHYIRNQSEHHHAITFQDEFRELLRRYEIEFDEQYVWD